MSFPYIAVILTTALCFTCVTCTVYNVTPNNNGCDYCLSLWNLSNDVKHFTTNTQLNFLPGLHHLSTDLFIQNVHNISLIGTTTSITAENVIIQCTSSPAGITMVNITNLTVQNIIIKNCKSKHDSLLTAVFIKKSYFIRLQSVQIYHDGHVISLVGANIFGNSYFHEVTCQEIKFYYNETTVKAKKHNILIDSFTAINHFASEYGIYLYMSQYSYEITLHVVNTTIQQLRRSAFLYAISNSSVNQNTIFIAKCQFHNNNYKTIRYLFYLENVNVNFNNSQFHHNKNFKCRALVIIINGNYATFFNFDLKHNRPNMLNSYATLVQIINVSNVTFEYCYFYENNMKVLDALDTIITIKHTTFSLTKTVLRCTLHLQNTDLLLIGPIVFHKNDHNFVSIIVLLNSIITVHGYIEFSQNYAYTIIEFFCNSASHCSTMRVLDNTTVAIINNSINGYFTHSSNGGTTYSQCLFQYISTTHLKLDNCLDAGNFSILIKYNRFNKRLFDILQLDAVVSNLSVLNMNENIKEYLMLFTIVTITHCFWLPQSAFNTTIPLNVNRQYITYINNSKLLHLNREKTLCYCSDEKHYDCFKDELDSLYPGQTVTVSLYANLNSTFNTEIITELHMRQTVNVACTVLNAKQNIQFIGKKCTTVKYTIAFPDHDSSWCELFLKIPQKHKLYDIFYIREIPCPLGFVKINGICQCYPSFKQFGFTDCDINTQTILRPSKGWILLNTDPQDNDSYSCYISQLCPYDYCKPYSFYLNLSIPDSQCQFQRSGLLCGQCQQGLSTMFSSHHCQHCSSIYLLLLIPIVIVGIVLVLMLFLLNLTVNDGTINPFIFM